MHRRRDAAEKLQCKHRIELGKCRRSHEPGTGCSRFSFSETAEHTHDRPLFRFFKFEMLLWLLSLIDFVESCGRQSHVADVFPGDLA